MPPPTGEPLSTHLAVRTRFFDRQVLDALAAGVAQVVVLGAGYDDRALRFRAPGVHYFEVDHPATQRDKRRRLGRIGVSPGEIALISLDFRDDDLVAVLGAAGHDASQQTLFICEGLFIYLNLNATVRLLQASRSCASAGSRLAASLATHPDGEDSQVVVANANRIRRHSRREPWLTILPAARQLQLLETAGWSTEPGDRSTEVRGMLLVLARAT
jgi:methyltransferase (TIGR00027 family)